MWRRRGRHHRRHQARVVEQAVQHVLCRSAVQGGDAHAEAEQIPVERHALVGAGHGHCGVVDAAKELAGILPRRVALSRREIDQLERMTLRVMKLDRLDAGRAGIGRRDGDGMRGDLPHIVVLQDFVGSIHVADDDGHMLEPGVVAVGPHRDEPAGGG